MRIFLKSIAKSVAIKTVYVLATCIIIAALFISVIRLVTPVFDKHRGDFENWASQLLQTPVTINNVRVSWYQYQPELSLNQVTILSKETREPLLQIQKVRIFFSIPQSIWQWKLVQSGIMISGTNVNVYETSTGEISIQGFPALGGFNEQPYKRETKFTDIMTLLSQQQRLILRDIDIRYTEFTGQKRFLTLYKLSFVNSDTQHTIFGEAILHQEIPTELNLAVQWSGNSFDLAQIKAKVYLYVSGLSLPQWMKGFSWNGWQINQGIGSTKIWATWNHGVFKKIQSTFQLYGLDLYSATDKSNHKINRLSGNVGWKREGKKQIFAGEDILIDLSTHLWPVTSFYFSLTPDVTGVLSPDAVNLGYLDINDVQSFLTSSPPLLSDSARQILSGLKLKGVLQNAAVTFSGPWTPWIDWSHISLNAHFSQVGFLPWHQFPGVSNLSGMIRWNGTHGNLSLQSNNAVFQYDSIFTGPITIDQLSGDVQWQFDQHQGWLFRIPLLHALNHDAAVNVNGTLTIPPDASPAADLSANFTVQKANHIARYLPMRIFDSNLAAWLREAFLSGEVPSGNAVLRGPLSDFPFDKGNGSFSISGAVKNIDLHFAPAWPRLQNVTGVLTFSGRRITVDVDQGRIFDIPFYKVHGEIPHIGEDQPQTLQIRSNEIKADLAQSLSFVHATPLEATIGKMFTGVEMHGPMTLKLGLGIPLQKPENTHVQGDMTIQDGSMNLVPWNLEATHLFGMVHFTESAVEANNIQGQIFNKPLQFSLDTIQKTKEISVVRAKIAANLSVPDLEKWLKLPFSQVVQGSADVTGEIDFSLKTPIKVHLLSNLAGMSVNLPDQYAKKAQEIRNFSADIIVQEQQPLKTEINYGDLFRAALVLDRKEGKFNFVGGDLQLGGGVPSWPVKPGLYITANLDQLDWEKIKKLINQSGKANLPVNLLRGIDIHTKTLDIAGQRLTQANLQISPTKNNWDVNITSREVAGYIQIPVNFTKQGLITAQFQKLNLGPSPNLNQGISDIDVKSLPSISFSANNVSYNNMPLGDVTFKTVPNVSGLNIKTLRITSPRMDLQASGDWTKLKTGGYVSHLHGSASSSKVSDLLTSFDFDVHNFIASKGHLDFNLAWKDAPYAPTLSGINGSASLDLQRGRIVEVDQASGAKMDLGRMLSLFSLQSLPRRLSLDFSDVFQKGYSFDSLRGDFHFEEGDVYTSNTHFDGPGARIDIYGRIGVAEKDYDLTMSVTPYVTSSLPVAAGLYGGPVGLLAGFAVNTVISAAVSKVSTYYYSVTGPWSNPNWQAVSGSGKE